MHTEKNTHSKTLTQANCFLDCFSQKSGRIYKVGGRFIEIHREVLEEFADCNLHENQELDKDFVSSVLVSVVPPDEMASGKIAPDAINFALGKQFL